MKTVEGLMADVVRRLHNELNMDVRFTTVPRTVISEDQQIFTDDVEIDGVLYEETLAGFYMNDVVYLNKRYATSFTMAHELCHHILRSNGILLDIATEEAICDIFG